MDAPSPTPQRKPAWLKVQAPGGPAYTRIKGLRQGLGLATVCEQARCPNIGECWGGGTATFMLLGDTCTRFCRFCNVKTAARGLSDPQEPDKVASAVRAMGLTYVVLTMVDRDDLPDGGADHVVRCVEAIKASSPGILVEVLSGDFAGDRAAIRTVAESPADVLAHNIETVRALTPAVRDAKCGYDLTLGVLDAYKQAAPQKLTKSSIMLGLGETDADLRRTLEDLRAARVDIVTLGQYLRPTERHLPVVEYVHPERFAAWKLEAEATGFLFCASGPLVRSSYKAGELFTERWLRERIASGGPSHVE